MYDRARHDRAYRRWLGPLAPGATVIVRSRRPGRLIDLDQFHGEVLRTTGAGRIVVRPTGAASPVWFEPDGSCRGRGGRLLVLASDDEPLQHAHATLAAKPQPESTATILATAGS